METHNSPFLSSNCCPVIDEQSLGTASLLIHTGISKSSTQDVFEAFSGAFLGFS